MNRVLRVTVFLLLLGVVAGLASGLRAGIPQSQTVEITITADNKFVPGASRHQVPKAAIADAKANSKAAPVVAFKSGDTIIIRNGGKVFYRPFSYSAGNKFDTGKVGLKPGETKRIVLKNGTGKWIPFVIFDDIHAYMRMSAVILPEKGSDSTDGDEASFTGDWNSDFGVMHLTQTGKHVQGNYEGYSPGTLEGDIDDKGWLQFTWKQATHNGVGKFKLGGDSFTGDWNYILSDGKSKGRGGTWNGTRKKS